MSAPEYDLSDIETAAHKHLWMCFTRHSDYHDPSDIPVIVRGEGAYVYDAKGGRYLDGLGSLFSCQVGHGREEIVEAAAAQAAELAFFPVWTYANIPAVRLAEKLAHNAPGDLNRVFFTSGGGEAVESAWKLAKQYFKLTGHPMKHKVISRYLAYHGTTHGALSITGIPPAKAPFEPLVPTAVKVPNTDFYRAPEIFKDDYEGFGRWAADQIEAAILAEGPQTVAAVVIEPVQNVGGSFPPPPGYLQRVREICDEYNVLFVADEVITGFGRVGEMFACNRYGVTPDIITVAKGITSGYLQLGAVIASERVFAPFNSEQNVFMHGFTYSGHPAACAAALVNLDILEREDLYGRVRQYEGEFQAALDGLRDIPIVGDVRGAGYFWTVELVKDQTTKEAFTAEESERVLRGYISRRLWEEGLYCRTDDRGEPVIQLSPPLVIGPDEFAEIARILRTVLTGALELL